MVRNRYKTREKWRFANRKIDDLLERTRRVQGMKRPSRRYQNVIWNFIDYEENILASERKWIYRMEDLACVSLDADHHWLKGCISDVIHLFSRRLLLVSPSIPLPLSGLSAAAFSRKVQSTLLTYFFSQRIFRDQESKMRTGKEEHLWLVSQFRMEAFELFILTIIFSFELLTPAAILHRLRAEVSGGSYLVFFESVVILTATLIFSAPCFLLTSVKRHGLLAATAAFCGLLTVLSRMALQDSLSKRVA